MELGRAAYVDGASRHRERPSPEEALLLVWTPSPMSVGGQAHTRESSVSSHDRRPGTSGTGSGALLDVTRAVPLGVIQPSGRGVIAAAVVLRLLHPSHQRPHRGQRDMT